MFSPGVGLQFHIFQFLPVRDLLVACRACKEIHQIVNPFNFANKKIQDLTLPYIKCPSTSNKPLKDGKSKLEVPVVVPVNGMVRINAGGERVVSGEADESDSDELLGCIGLPYFDYPENTHFYMLGDFHCCSGRNYHPENDEATCGTIVDTFIKDEIGNSIVSFSNDTKERSLAFYPPKSCVGPEGSKYALNVRIRPDGSVQIGASLVKFKKMEVRKNPPYSFRYLLLYMGLG